MRPALAFAAVALLAACSHWSGPQGATARATLAPTQGNTASGSVYFTQQGDRLLVSGEVRGLAPNSDHGFHVHEKGDCSGDATSAGGHYNPGKQPHGRQDTTPHHAGDLPSLHADASGVATINFESRDFRVGAGEHNALGRAVVVHRDPDDFTTQPDGHSGPRIACGVIQRS